MGWPDSFTPQIQTTHIDGAYPTTSYPPAITSTPSGGYAYGNDFGGGSLVTTAATVKPTGIVGDAENTCKPCSNKGAIIALGVISGLLILGVAILLYLLIALGRKKHKEDAERERIIDTVEISPGYGQQKMGRYRHKEVRTNCSRGGRHGDSLSYPDSESAVLAGRRRGRDNNRQMGGLGIRTDQQAGNFGVGQSQFRNPNWFPGPGNGNQNGLQGIPPVHLAGQQFRNPPVPDPPRGPRDEEPVPPPSEVGSSVGEEPRRQAPSRRNVSKTSTALSRGRSRRKE